ncbi:hypothetical protein [Geminisphaera colitermitum]|uniref:hypothetical protein n=1 Tax=Geminisphaera colitermitum TaxID=1148786 RepID=UPI000158D4BD|nr:hypothetical protein [Geminisphaera colitermitum]
MKFFPFVVLVVVCMVSPALQGQAYNRATLAYEDYTFPAGVKNRITVVGFEDSFVGQLSLYFATAEQGALADNSVQQVTTVQTVYGVNQTGDQVMLRYSTSVEPSSIVRRGSDGRFDVQTPTANAHPTPKSYVDARTPQPAYLVFVIPIGPGFYDFELKATLSNFGEHAPFTDLVFYYHSPDPARTSVTSQVGAVPSVWFTDTGNSDKRRWRKQPANQSIWQTRIGTVPAVIVYVPIDATIRPGNAPLIWSYQRITATDYEQVWYPIFPATSPVLATP